MSKVFVVLKTYFHDELDTNISHVLGVTTSKAGVEEILRKEGGGYKKATVRELHGDIEVELPDRKCFRNVRIHVTDHELMG